MEVLLVVCGFSWGGIVRDGVIGDVFYILGGYVVFVLTRLRDLVFI